MKEVQRNNNKGNQRIGDSKEPTEGTPFWVYAGGFILFVVALLLIFG